MATHILSFCKSFYCSIHAFVSSLFFEPSFVGSARCTVHTYSELISPLCQSVGKFIYSKEVGGTRGIQPEILWSWLSLSVPYTWQNAASYENHRNNIKHEHPQVKFFAVNVSQSRMTDSSKCFIPRALLHYIHGHHVKSNGSPVAVARHFALQPI